MIRAPARRPREALIRQMIMFAFMATRRCLRHRYCRMLVTTASPFASPMLCRIPLSLLFQKRERIETGEMLPYMLTPILRRDSKSPTC